MFVLKINRQLLKNFKTIDRILAISEGLNSLYGSVPISRQTVTFSPNPFNKSTPDNLSNLISLLILQKPMHQGISFP